MKKQIFSLGLMLAAAFTLTNCTKEIENPAQESESLGVPFEIIANTVDTKTVNHGVHTLWATGDQINVFHAVGETAEYVNDTPYSGGEGHPFVISEVDEGRFVGELSEPLDSQEKYDWYTFYPYSSYITTPANTSSGYMTVASSADDVQVQTGNDSMSHIAGSNYPLAGRAIATPANSTPQIQMSHVSSLIAINVKNTLEEPLVVEKVAFSASENIVGTYYIDFSGDITPESFVGSGENYVSKTASLRVEEGAAISTDQSAVFYLAVKPFVAKANEKLVLSVNGYAKELTMTKDVTFSAGKIKTLNFAYDEVKEAGVVTATISFTTDAQRVSYSTSEQVWSNDGITFTNSKATATSNVANNVSPVRLYKNSDIKIDAPGFITKIEFNSATGDYFGNLKSLLPNATVSGQVVTEVYDGSASSVSYSLTTGQVRLNSITVTYSTTGETPEQPENPEPEAVTLSSIAVSEPQIEYTVGDGFVNPTVTATYSDNSTKEVTAEFSGYDMNTAGTYTVNVSYTEKEVTATDSYEIVVKVKEATEIVAHTVTWNLSKDEASEASTSKIAWEADGVSMANSKGTAQTNANNYYPGVDNRTSTRFYSGNSLVISPKSGYAINSIVFTATTEGYANALKGSTWTNASATVSGTTVTVNPEDGCEEILASITGTCGFTKVVVELVPSEGYVKPVIVLSSITLSGQTTNYTVGDTFSFTGTVTATYSNGATKTVTPTTVSSPDMSSAGDKEVTVTYTEDGVSVTAKYTINVAEKATEPEEPGQPDEVIVLSEEFDNSSKSDSSSAITASTFANFSGSTDKAYKSQYGGIKLGSSKAVGYITSKSLDLSSAFTVQIDACKYGSDSGNIVVTVGSQSETISNSSLKAAGTFTTFTLTFDAATSSSTVKIATSSKRAYIDNVVITRN